MTEHRLEITIRLVQLVTKMIPQQRGHSLSEAAGRYEPTAYDAVIDPPAESPDDALHNIPPSSRLTLDA